MLQPYFYTSISSNCLHILEKGQKMTPKMKNVITTKKHNK